MSEVDFLDIILKKLRMFAISITDYIYLWLISYLFYIIKIKSENKMLSKNAISDNFISYINNLKQQYNLKIVDTHVHPFDVMGIVHYQNYENLKKYNYKNIKKKGKQPNLIEKMEVGKIINLLVRVSYKLYPQLVISEIKLLYDNIVKKNFINEMEYACIDTAVLLPVEPWVPTDFINMHYSDKQFLLLGSVNIHSTTIDAIEKQLIHYTTDFHIAGIKLHPNLQNFKPQPSHNLHDVADKLRLIYKFAEDNNLYLLFHGGTTNFTKYSDKRYEKYPRSRTNGLLKNFCDENGESEIFSTYSVPIVIAHLGHYGLNKIDLKLIKKITDHNDNIYFDTSGVSPKFIQQFIEQIGSRKLVWGSDAAYNSIMYSLYFVYKAAKMAKTNEKFNDIMINILGKNFYSNILKN